MSKDKRAAKDETMKRRHSVPGKRISRRTLLAGAGGLAVSLPMLEAMTPSPVSAAAGDPMRYVIALQGIAQARANTAASASFEPLRRRGVASDVAIVEGLDVQRSGPGHMEGAFHRSVIQPLMAGVTTPSSGALREITSDQIVAQAWAGQAPHDYLHISTQTRPAGSRLGYTGAGSGPMSCAGASRTLSPIESPLAAWERLFSGVSGTTTTPTPTPSPSTGPSAAERTLARDHSVLDIAARRAEALRPIVSRADWRRMQEHFEAIRALELKLADLMANPTGNGSSGGGTMTGGGSTSGGCAAPPQPTDPAQGARWSNETLRGEIFADMIALAFACDLTRSCAWMLSWWQSHLPAMHITGEFEDLHWITHNDPSDGRGASTHQDEYTAWHVDMYARLIENLKNTTDGTSGAPLIESTVAVMAFEGVGAHGFGGSGMTWLIGGRPSELNLGGTIRASGAHPAQLLNSAMMSVGVNEDLGELRGPIAALMR